MNENEIVDVSLEHPPEDKEAVTATEAPDGWFARRTYYQDAIRTETGWPAIIGVGLLKFAIGVAVAVPLLDTTTPNGWLKTIAYVVLGLAYILIAIGVLSTIVSMPVYALLYRHYGEPDATYTRVGYPAAVDEDGEVHVLKESPRSFIREHTYHGGDPP